MYELPLPDDVAALEAIQTYLRHHLNLIEQALDGARAREREAAQGLPPANSWRLQPTGREGYAVLHEARCPKGARHRLLDREQAILALDDRTGQTAVCARCRPDRALQG